ncbi:microtubule cross-linking factor 1 [Engraulis encrasicolus]|uniref:microtubule cross-linking factor 1 n=1 Tax=Engraulis encrasicolus TaxID=184585 RepID=UPI002FD3951C
MGNVLRRRGSHKDKRSAIQEDSADLRCQLQFAKEESALMRKELAKLGRERDELELELTKYKGVYGDMDSPVAACEIPGGGPPSTREAELRLRLKLVEEEANILGRKLVELEVENRGLRAENEDLRGNGQMGDRGEWGRDTALGSGPTSPSPYESVGELRRHLQFVEEEADLLRRSIAEMEDHNRQLTTELSRFKFGPGDGGQGGVVTLEEGQGGVSAGSGGLAEQLEVARVQISELSGKVLKLQYENRVLVSNAQRSDLAGHTITTETTREEEEEEEVEEEEEEEAPKREGPVGGESDSEEVVERSAATSGLGSSSGAGLKPWEADVIGQSQRRRAEEGLRREAERLGRSVDRLISDTDSLITEGGVAAAMVVSTESVSSSSSSAATVVEGGVGGGVARQQDAAVLETVSTRMKAFRAELQGFVDRLGDGQQRERERGDRGDDLSPLPHLTESSSFLSTGTSLSRDSPIGTLGRDLLTDLQREPHTVHCSVIIIQKHHQRSSTTDTAISMATASPPTLPYLWQQHHHRHCRIYGNSITTDTAVPMPYPALTPLRPLRPLRLPSPPGQSDEGPLLRSAGQGLVGAHWSKGAPGHTRAPRPPGVRPEIRDPSSVPEVTSPARELQFRLDRLRPGTDDRDNLMGPVTQQEARRGLELTGLQTTHGEGACPVDRGVWPQERALLQQELRVFRHHTVVLYMKLRWILTHWRLGRRGDASVTGDDAPSHAEFECLENIPELAVAMEPGDGEGDATRPCAKISGGVGGEGPAEPGTLLPSPDLYQHQKQVGDNRRVLHALRWLLEEFGCELRDEEARRLQLQQTYANQRASWEIQHAEMRKRLTQLEEVAGGPVVGGVGVGSAGGSACEQEREEQRRLLAESHSAALELRWRLHHGERRWRRERQELIQHFHREKQAWIQKEVSASPQLSPCKSPRGPPPRSPRSLSDSDAAETRLRAGPDAAHPGEERLFLDALSLDPPSSLEQVPPPSRLQHQKRFPCLNEALNEVCEKAGPAVFPEDEPTSGSLLRAKSVCSMSDFQRLMDSSPFLPDKTTGSRHGDRSPVAMGSSSGFRADRSDVTPPLSPDDLKYIEEFNNRGCWDIATALSASCPIPGPLSSILPPEARRGVVPGDSAVTPSIAAAAAGTVLSGADPFQPNSWFLTTSATLTTSTLSSPERCRPSGPSGPGSGLGLGPANAALALTPPHPDQHFGGGGAGTVPVGGAYASSSSGATAATLDLNLSDDMKEVAFSVRNAIRPLPTTPTHAATPPHATTLRDSACQTNGFTSRGTQTCHVVSVGLQTDAGGLRTLTSSPHRCLTPKGGGSTPVSSPSRSLRRPQYVTSSQGSKFERPCCSPKYGSPKLQRKPERPGAGIKTAAESAGGGGVGGGGGSSSRTTTPTSTPQKGASGGGESAWARSTTTRDSPVHATINDGHQLSSLFNIIDHTPLAALEPVTATVVAGANKYTRSPSRSARPQQAAAAAAAAGADPTASPGGSEGKCSTVGGEEMLRGAAARGRSPSPVQHLIVVEMAEVPSIRQDLSAPPGHTLAENAARLLNRKLQEQAGTTSRDEQRRGLQLPSATTAAGGGATTQGAHGRDAKLGETSADRAGSMEDLPRSPVAPPLEACFLRPARPPNRRPPSRWAGARSPNSSPTWGSNANTSQRFQFPPTTQSIPEGEEPRPA